MPKEKLSVNVRRAVSSDRPWIELLYKKYKKHLGSFNLFMSWDRYIKEKKGEFLVIEGKAFIRFAWMKKYSAYVVHEIAVDEKYLGAGFGKFLLKQVPAPILLKCNKDNERGNAFYKSIGMNCAGLTQTKAGVEQIIWMKSTVV